MTTITTLPNRRESFARAVAFGRSKREAAIAAGYSKHSASSIGSQLALIPAVAARIDELRQPHPVTLAITAPVTLLTTVFNEAGQSIGVFFPEALVRASAKALNAETE
jgi:phage terminase small subunit